MTILRYLAVYPRRVCGGTRGFGIRRLRGCLSPPRVRGNHGPGSRGEAIDMVEGGVADGPRYRTITVQITASACFSFAIGALAASSAWV